MKRKRFSVEQIVAVLKQAHIRLHVSDLVRRTGISRLVSFIVGKGYIPGLELT